MNFSLVEWRGECPALGVKFTNPGVAVITFVQLRVVLHVMSHKEGKRQKSTTYRSGNDSSVATLQKPNPDALEVIPGQTVPRVKPERSGTTPKARNVCGRFSTIGGQYVV